MKTRLKDHKTSIYITIICAVIFSLFAHQRLLKNSGDPHFLYLAEALLAGQLHLTQTPPHQNDWASYKVIDLRGDAKARWGAQLKGVYHRGSSTRFKTLRGEERTLLKEHIARQETRYYVSFPPLPALLMIPMFLLFGHSAPDVLFTLLFAALNGGLLWRVLSLLTERGLSVLSTSDRYWICALFSLGTAHLWCAVLGQVWYSALIIGVTCHLLFLINAIDMRRPILAGVCLALAFYTRASLVLLSLFFYAQVCWPTHPKHALRERIKRATLFSVPPLILGVLLLIYNQARFDSYAEFGHTFLAGGQLQRIQDYGLFHPIFLKKNIIAAFLLLPSLSLNPLDLKLSWHGMCIQFSSPALLWTLPAFCIPLLERLKSSSSLRRGESYQTSDRQKEMRSDRFTFILGGVAGALFILLLFYQNTGWVQYSWRFILDPLPLLICMIATHRIRLMRLFKIAIIWGICINSFGALSFGRSLLNNIFVNLPLLSPH